jgi:hypothetical protein
MSPPKTFALTNHHMHYVNNGFPTISINKYVKPLSLLHTSVTSRDNFDLKSHAVAEQYPSKPREHYCRELEVKALCSNKVGVKDGKIYL